MKEVLCVLGETVGAETRHEICQTEILSALREQVGAEAFNEISQAFIQDTSGAGERIESAIAARDAKSLGSIIHMLTGCCRVLGAEEAERACLRMEALVREENWPAVAKMYQPLCCSIKRLSEGLAQCMVEPATAG